VKPRALLLLYLAALPGLAGAAEGPDPLRLRDELRAMEALLDSTVEQVSRPNPGFFLAGSPSCRGYLLKGYGFVFVLPARWLPMRQQADQRLRRPPARRGNSTEGMVMISGDRPDPRLSAIERQVEIFQQEAEQQQAEAEREFEQVTRELRARLLAAQAAWGDVPPSPVLPVLATAPPSVPESPAAEPPAPAVPAAPPAAPPVPAKPPAPADSAVVPAPPPVGPVRPPAPWLSWAEREPQDPEDKGPERLVGDVRDAVIAALEAHGPSLLSLRPEETISVVVDFVAGAPFLDDETRPARSLTLRVRKRDLDDRRAGRLSPEELRRRVEAAEY
jgi:hypothetical protein